MKRLKKKNQLSVVFVFLLSLFLASSLPASTPSEIIQQQFTAPCWAVSERPDESQISSSVPCTPSPDKPLPQPPVTLSRLSPLPASEAVLKQTFYFSSSWEGNKKNKNLTMNCWHICSQNCKSKKWLYFQSEGRNDDLNQFLHWDISVGMLMFSAAALMDSTTKNEQFSSNTNVIQCELY